ncbi:MAG: hypothetical protein NT049_16805, partial [Planctomycetota bacterium]|nr:hypothetical protein [Planctomycetota bacterium]
MDDSSPPSDNPVIFQCPKCALLCEEWGEADKRPHEGRCRHCLATITVPKRSSIPAQYEVENVDFQYDLAHVFQCISEGWDVFRDLGSAIGLSVFDHLSDFAKPTKRLDERIADGIYEVVTCAGPGYGLIAPNLRDMAFEMTFPRGKCMHGKEETARRQYDKELTPEQQLQASRLLA